MKDSIAICGANSINAITDVIHDYYCGKTDRQSIQIRVQDAADQLASVKKHLIAEDGELYKQPATPTSESNSVSAKIAHTETVEEIRAKAIKEYGDHPHLYAQQRDGYVAGYSAGLAHSQSLDIRRVLEYIQRNANGNHIYTGQGILAMQPEIEKMLKEK